MEARVLRVLDLYYKVAVFELKMRKINLRTRLVLQIRDFRAAATEERLDCALDLHSKLCLSSRGCGCVLRVLDLYYKVAIFELELRKCTSRSRLVLQSCDFRAEDAED